MVWLILGLLYIICFIIIYQDITSRAVVWIAFPCLALTGGLYNYFNEQSFATVIKNSVLNIGFLATQFLLLRVYLYFKKDTTGIQKKIGWGDILFLLASCFFFSPFTFLAFYSASLIFSLLIFLALGRFISTKNAERTVPLAGLQSGFLLLFITLNIVLQNNLANDSWLLSKIE